MLTLSGAGQPQNGGAGIEERFVISVQTDNAGTSADNEFTIPWVGTYDIDWGDGNTDAGVVDTQIHTYASAGTYDVAVTATTGRIYFNNGGDKAKLLDIKNWGSCAWTSMERAFEGCSMMDITATDIPDFSNLTSLGAMFKRCINLIFNDSINFWNLGNVNKLTLGYHLGIFSGALKFNQPINNWDVSNVTNMSSLFGDDIGPNVFNQPLNNWDVSNVSNMDLMFRKCSNFNQPLDNWDVSNVTIMRGMFNSCADFNQNIGMWDVSNVNRFADGFMGMFSFATSFNNGGSPSINNWDVSKATAFGGRYSSNSGLFSGASSFNQPLGQWDVTNVTDMRHTFRNATSFDQDISNWNIINVGNFMYFMTGISLSNNNYDELLIGWETTLQAAYPNGAGYPHDINITFGNSQYTYKAAAARQTLVDTYGWTITDGGQLEVNDETYFSINTTKGSYLSSDSDQFKLRLINEPVNLLVEWGDGTIDTITSYDQPEITHTYPSSGIYNVKITTSSPYTFLFNNGGDRNKMLDIKNWGNLRAVANAFFSCFNLTVSATDAPVIPGLSLSQCFRACYSLSDIDVSTWDLSNVNRLNVMFNQSSNVDTSFANWDINQVIDFSNFLPQATLSTSNYNETLISWAAQSPQINKSISFGNSQYSYEAAAARQTLIDTYGWTITDGGQVAAPEFAISVKTDNAGTSADNQFTLPWIGTYDVDWGDGVVETGVVDTQTHTYDSAGTYDIKVTAATGSIFFNAPRFTDYKLLQIKNWGDCEWTSLESAFSGCANLDFDSSNIDAPNLRNCTSLYKTFNFCTLLGNLNGNNVDLSSWDVSNVTNIGEFFITYNTRVNVNLSGWVINPNITFGRLLDRCNILDVTDWDVSNVTNFSNIFHSATRLNEIAGLNTWDISNGVDFTSIFRRVYDLTSLGDLSSWSFAPNSNLTNMFFASIRENMDQNTKNSILNLDVSNATNMRNMFNYSNITSWLNLSNWDVSGVSDFNGFLSNSTLTTQNYDETLISWATQSLQNNINISFGNSQYTLGGSAEAARNTLINTYGWTITDGGGIFVGLLDTYTGAAAAYSLRDLASASVGSAVVRVRRSSDNTEQDFTAAEITDGTLTTFTGANDGFVTTWYDQSGNSVNAVQATATLQPKLVTSGVVRQVNNKPALTLFSNNVGFSTNTSYAGSNFSIVSVYDKTLSSGADTIFLDNNLNSPDGIFSYRNGSKQGVYRSGDKTIEGNLKDGQAIAFTLLSNNVISYYNNTDLVGSSTDANAAANVDFNSFRIGRSNPFEIQEVILYPTNQTPNVQGFNDNMNNYYSVYEIPVSGLLFDYPDPLVAYSLRQLTTFESGNKVNVVRVRRSNDNVEKDFIDTEITDGTLTTFTGANDGFVVKWYDQSGDLNDAIQTSAVNQPKLVDNGTVILDNGKPAIKYDSTGFDTLTTLNNVTGINSIFYVLNAETSTGGPTQSLLGDNFGALDYVSGQSGNIILWTGVPNDIKNGSNYIDSQPYNFLATDRPLVQSLITMIHNSPIGAFNQISEDRSIGRSWEGKLQELVVYSSDQSANRTGIEANINTEYTIY